MQHNLEPCQEEADMNAFSKFLLFCVGKGNVVSIFIPTTKAISAPNLCYSLGEVSCQTNNTTPTSPSICSLLHGT